MGGENAARISAGNMRTVTVPQPNVPNRAEAARSFERAKLMAEIEIIVKGRNAAGRESVERVFDFVEYGTDLQSSIALALRKRGMDVSEKRHKKHGDGFGKIVLTNVRYCIPEDEVHFSLLGSDGQRRVPMAKEEDGLTGKKAADTIVSQPKIIVVIEPSRSACPLGDKEPKGPIQKQRLEELLWLNIDSGVIESGNPIFLGYRYDGLPPQYFQPLTLIEPRGFETQTGFVPGAALVQDRADLGAMAWLRVAALKADGELGIARYYDAIGERGTEQMPAKVEAAAMPQAEEKAFTASSGIVQGEVQECVTGHAPAAQEAPMRFVYDSFEPEPVRSRKGKKPAENPVEEGNAAKTENKVEKKGENPVRNDDYKIESKPSAKPAHGETPFWKIDRKGRMKPLNAPIELDEDAPSPMPKLKLAVPKITGKLMPARMKAPVARQKEVKNPAPLQERRKKRRKRPEMARAETERRAEKPKKPAAKARFGDAAPLSSGIRKKKARREMPAVELKKERKAKRRAEKRENKIKPELTPAAIAKQKVRRKEKKMVLDERAGEKRAAKRRAERKRRSTVEYLVAKRAPKRGKRKYWAPLSLR